MNVKLKCPKDCGSASVAGVEYQADENGVIDVPVEHAQILYGHGFEQIAESDAEALAKAQADAQAKADAEKAAADAKTKADAEALAKASAGKKAGAK